MCQDRIRILIASLPDRDSVVAEVWLDGFQFGELRQEGGRYLWEFYGRPDKQPWALDADELTAALDAAKAKLMGSVK